MKTKEYEIEVIIIKNIKVVLPEYYSKKETLDDWEKGLWPLEEGVNDIARYAAEMAAKGFGEYDIDGVRTMITSRYETPNYEKNPFQVIAIETDEVCQTEILIEKDWT